jgi:hypothetical protein
MLLASLPVFALAMLFGGISPQQVARVFLVTLATALAAGSLGSTLALWREKTFQTLTLTALTLVFWTLGCEAVAAGVVGAAPAGIQATTWAGWLSPLRAITISARPATDIAAAGWLQHPTTIYSVFAGVVTLVLNLVAVGRVRIWNPSREIRPQTSRAGEASSSIWSAEHDPSEAGQRTRADRARSRHVDARLRTRGTQRHRSVWRNPILWREVCTWAYGRKVIGMRLAYLLLFLLVAGGLSWTGTSQPTYQDVQDTRAALPDAAKPTVPFLVVSLVIVNALAVTSITNERDGRSLDLLLVTDLSPAEFLFGKLGGILWVAKEMLLLPLLLCCYLWWQGVLITENLAYVMGGLLVMNLFVAMLGMHCGMTYANSRTAVLVSLGTVFFLFVGIATCIVMMISFSGSFHVQLAPFLAFIIGGGVGLYVSLGARNPSPAILVASLLLPFATFYAITSYLLSLTLAVFLVTAVAYSFTTAAMMVPALSEFDFAMGRSHAAEE